VSGLSESARGFIGTLVHRLKQIYAISAGNGPGACCWSALMGQAPLFEGPTSGLNVVRFGARGAARVARRFRFQPFATVNHGLGFPAHV